MANDDFQTEENLRLYHHWAEQYLQRFLVAYQTFDQRVAEAAEARERGETTTISELPNVLLRSLGAAEDDPQALVRAIHASYEAAHQTIVEILREYWQQSR